MDDFKKLVHQICIHTVHKKIRDQGKHIKEIQQASSEDTKSSAGDKYETSREMMKQEINKASQQMAVFEKMEQVLMRMKLDEKPGKIGLGSLIQTNEGWYFFSVSIGKVMVEKTRVYVLSMASPLGTEMFDKQKGDVIDFRGRKIEIRELL